MEIEVEDEPQSGDPVQREREMAGTAPANVEPGHRPDPLALDRPGNPSRRADRLEVVVRARSARARVVVDAVAHWRLLPSSQLATKGHDPLGGPDVGRACLGALERRMA